jgi:hypothetical protein
MLQSLWMAMVDGQNPKDLIVGQGTRLVQKLSLWLYNDVQS